MKLNIAQLVDNQDGTGEILIKTRAKESSIYNLFETNDSHWLWFAGFNGWDKTDNGFKIYFDISDQLEANDRCLEQMTILVKKLETS